jgi:hypothetical protein
VAEYDIDDVAGAEMLAQCCTSLDRAEALRAEIEGDGSVIRSRGQIKDHPALKHELAARAFVVRTLSRLGLNFEPLRASRRERTACVRRDDDRSAEAPPAAGVPSAKLTDDDADGSAPSAKDGAGDPISAAADDAEPVPMFQPDEKKLARTIKQVVCRFIGDFKVGDNLVRNADACAG